MSPLPGNEYLSRLSEALVSEIKSEMGRRDLSARGLAAIIGENPQYVTSRIGAGNPRTGKRVELTVADLATIAGAFDMEPIDLYNRAAAAVAAGEPAEVIDIRDRKRSDPDANVTPVRHERTAANRRKNRVEDEPENTP